MNDNPRTARGVTQRLLADAAQHPATLLPAAAAAAAGIYLALLSALFGGRLPVFGVLAASALFAAGSFAWRYMSRRQDETDRWLEEMAALRAEERARTLQAETEGLRNALQAELAGISPVQGLGALTALVREYELLKPDLAVYAETDTLSMSNVPELADETYRRALRVLSAATGLMRAAESSERANLHREAEQLERDVEAQPDAAQKELKREMLASHRQRIHMLDQLHLRIDQLLFQVHRCETSLQRTRIELAGIRAGTSATSVDSVTRALNSTITQAKEVQEELTRLGYGDKQSQERTGRHSL